MKQRNHMVLPPSLREDLHVHSTFSDGANTVEENVVAAIDRGLTRICCVDHVRKDTYWVPEFVSAVQEVAERYRDVINVQCGVEAKFLNARGILDLPGNLAGVDFILAADHQVPHAGGILHPRDAVDGLESGRITAEAIVRDLVSASVQSMLKYPSVILAHPFSILPKIGLSERDIPIWGLTAMAHAAVLSGSIIEISERWTCPSPVAIELFSRFGVDLRCSTDAHAASAIGRYTWVAERLDDAFTRQPRAVAMTG